MSGKYLLISSVVALLVLGTVLAGCTDNGEKKSNHAPEAKLTLSPGVVHTYESVRLDASASTDDSGIVEYRWDFDGDGTWDTTTKEGVVAHNYTDDGTYNVSVEVIDGGGRSDQAYAAITVLNRAPECDGTASAYVGKSLETITFTLDAEDMDGTVVACRWDYDGDGTWDWEGSGGGKTQYSYKDDGTYMATYAVEDDDGAITNGSFTVVINNRPPELVADVNRTEALTYSPINFSVADSTDADGTIDLVKWDFDGDGTWDHEGCELWYNYSYTNDGVYYPKVTIYDDDNASASQDLPQITIDNRPPMVNIEIESTGVHTYKVVDFNVGGGDIDGSIVSYKWDFNGDGVWDYSSSTEGNTTYEYHDNGNFKVKLYVKDDDGAVSGDELYINVLNSPPEVDLSVGSTSVLTYEDVVFTWSAQDVDGNIISLVWDFDNDGYKDWQSQTPTVNTVTYQYEDNGVYTAVFKVKDDDGDTTVREANITVSNRAPTVDIQMTSTTVTSGRQVGISANANDMDGYITQYQWDFNGDGVWDESTNSDYVEHTYTSTGTYTLRVQVTDDDGDTGEDSLPIIVVQNRPPVAVAGDDIKGYKGVPVTLDGSGSYDPDGDDITYSWDFDGDGTYDWQSTTTGVVSHTYNTEGTYTAVLKVSDGALMSTDSVNVTIVVNHAPVAEAGPDQSANAGDLLNFDGSGSYDPDGDALTYFWNFGDGFTASGVSVTHIYNAGGSFTVTLTVTDPGGLTDSDTLTVSVTGPTKFAIVIGISDYPGTDSDLYYPDDDANSWAAYLHGLGYLLIGPVDSNGQHTDAPFINSQATRSAIIDAIRDLKAIEGPDSYVAFTYSGHGVYQYGDSYMLDYTEAGVSSSELASEFSGYESNHMFFFFDCCQSGDFDNDLSPYADYVAVACATNEYSLDDPNVGHGGFTYGFLIDGLQSHSSWSAEDAFNNAYDWCSTQYGYNSFHPEYWDADTSNPFYV